MEQKQKTRKEEIVCELSAEDKRKVMAKILSSETDSCISMTFDSVSDCGYKSGEISSTLSSTSENISSLTPSESGLQPSKSEQNTCDSGFITDANTDAFSPLSSDCYSFDSCQVFSGDSPQKSTKLLWQDVFSQDKDGDTILHLAIVEASLSNCRNIIFPLIRLAPHPDFLDISNDLYQTPLHLATLTGKSNIVRRLVVAGATLDIQDHSGNIPLHIACRSGDLDCVQSILAPITEPEVHEAGCSYQVYLKDHNLSHLINMKNYDGQSCVHLAAAGGFQKVMECLFNHHADIDDQDGKSGRTALHYAVESGNIELVRLLLSTCHANPHVRNYAGQTSFCIAWALRKRNPSKLRRALLDVLKHYAEKWVSSSEYESESSSDEAEVDDNIHRSSKSVPTK